MKKILLMLAILIIANQILKSQDYGPIQHKFYTYIDSTYTTKDSVLIDASNSRFSISHFVAGFQWGQSPYMSKGLFLNVSHGSNDYTDPSITNDTTDMIIFIDGLSTSGSAPTPLLAQGFRYKPALVIDTTKIPYLQKRPNDLQRAVFGFKTVRGETIVNNPSDPDFQYLVLRDTGNYVSRNIPVLDGNWMDDQFATLNIDTIDHNARSEYFGWEWYLAVNLKRGDLTDKNMGSDTVLVFTMPYKTDTNSVDSIRFSFLPANVGNDTTSIRNYGYFRGIKKVPTVQTNGKKFVITKNMLPANDSNITINAVFYTDNQTQIPIYHNWKLNCKEGNLSTIKNLNIRCYYYGNLDVKINYVQVITPICDEVLWGEHDEDMVSKVQNNCLNIYDDTSFTNHRKVVKRIYFRDEFGPQWWISAKYLNDLVGNIGTTEAGRYCQDIYSYYVNMAELWTATSAANFGGIFSPIVPITSGDYKSLGYGWGWRHLNWGSNFYSDSLNSDYETAMIWTQHFSLPQQEQNLKWLRGTTLDSALDVIGSSLSFQSWFEILKYTCFVNDYSRAMLYSDKPWWGFNLIDENWHVIARPTGDTSYVNYFALHGDMYIGEEHRAWIWSQLIMGGKGLMYDGEWEFPINIVDPSGFYPDGIGAAKSFANYQAKWSSYPTDFIFKDEVGSDYLDLSNDFTKIQNYIDTNYVKQYMEINPKRIYMGRKSARYELRKAHQFAAYNQSTILSLKLAAAYFKGYREWYQQDTVLFGNTDSIMKKFILLDTSYIKVRPLGRTKLVWDGEGYCPVNYYEPWDSIFLDITILRDSADHGLTGDHWTLGVQNRRTDPLIFAPDTIQGVGIDSSMKFYSTAEISII